MEHRKPHESLIPFYLLSGTVFILPILFLPTFNVPLSILKTVVVYVVALISFIIWLRSRIKDGKMYIIYSPLLLSAAAIPIIYFFSAFFSSSRINSIIGTGTETSTFYFTLLLFLIMFLVGNFYRSPSKILFAYLAILGSAGIIETFHILRYVFGPTFLSFGFFDVATSTPLGSWFDLSIFAGIIALIAVSILDFLKPGKVMNLAIIAILAESIGVLCITNYYGIWTLVAGFGITMIVYRITYYHHRLAPTDQAIGGNTNFFPLFTGFLVLMAIIGAMQSAAVKHENKDFAPSFSQTMSIVKSNLIAHPLLGTGPNRFTPLWDLYKPQSINTTDNWDTPAVHGSSYMTTAFATTGILGIISWLIFFGSLMYFGGVLLFIHRNPVFDFYIFSSFFATVYFIVLEVVYYPGTFTLFLSFFCYGLFISALLSKITFNYITVILKEKRFTSGVYYLFILFLCGAVVSTYYVGRKYIAGVFYQKGVLEMQHYPDYAAKDISAAISLAPIDLYDRTYAALMVNSAELLTQSPFDKNESATKFQNYFNQAEGASDQAIAIDQHNFENWMTRGDLYSFLVPLNFSGAYDTARQAYDKASVLNPENPKVKRAIAELLFLHKDPKTAESYARQALELKPDYTDAAFLIVQLKADQKDLNGALDFLNSYIPHDPQNLLLYYERGVLFYAEGKYDSAAAVFEQILSINPFYANAKYYLAFCYYKLGRTDLAIPLVQSVADLNPNNTEVAEVLKNLKEGKSPTIDAPNTSVATTTATTTKKTSTKTTKP